MTSHHSRFCTPFIPPWDICCTFEHTSEYLLHPSARQVTARKDIGGPEIDRTRSSAPAFRSAKIPTATNVRPTFQSYDVIIASLDPARGGGEREREDSLLASRAPFSEPVTTTSGLCCGNEFHSLMRCHPLPTRMPLEYFAPETSRKV